MFKAIFVDYSWYDEYKSCILGSTRDVRFFDKSPRAPFTLQATPSEPNLTSYSHKRRRGVAYARLLRFLSLLFRLHFLQVRGVVRRRRHPFIVFFFESPCRVELTQLPPNIAWRERIDRNLNVWRKSNVYRSQTFALPRLVSVIISSDRSPASLRVASNQYRPAGIILVSFSYTCLTMDRMYMYVLRGAEARRVTFHQPINRQAARLEAATGLVTCRVSHDEEGRDLRVMRCLRT